jgi:crotonobetaine/carnitine-CoA ligase
LLEYWAAERPDAPFAKFSGDYDWTYEQTLREAQVTAHSLRALGVRQGDNVLCWLPNGPEMLRVWLGLNLLGAVFVPFNVSYRGKTLENVLNLSQARLLVGHWQLIPRLNEIEIKILTDIVVIGGDAQLTPGLQMHKADVLTTGVATPVVPERTIESHDTQSIIFTSGTTGPSKAVLSSYAHLYAQGSEAFDFLDGDDCFMVNLPMFHCGGTIPVGVALANGGSVAILDKFKIREFWSIVKSNGVTVAYLIAGLPQLLLRQPQSDKDKDHSLSTVFVIGQHGKEFRERFGCDYYTLFNMSETCTPILSEKNTPRIRSCGRLRNGVEARLVDEYDNEVPIGETGELILRTERPWMLSHGYAANLDATAKAWRNGWFHTGDLLSKDIDGYYYFCDRLKDAIRRKGENISSLEVETAACSHHSVLEAAAVAVKAEDDEEEVLLLVSSNPGTTVEPRDLTRFLINQLPYFMVPRYIRVVPSLPKTPTGKVRKAELRAEASAEGCWDREAAGIILKKEKLT